MNKLVKEIYCDFRSMMGKFYLKSHQIHSWAHSTTSPVLGSISRGVRLQTRASSLEPALHPAGEPGKDLTVTRWELCFTLLAKDYLFDPWAGGEQIW